MAYLVIGILIAYVGFTFVSRFQQGRCRQGHYGRAAMSCGYPAAPQARCTSS